MPAPDRSRSNRHPALSIPALSIPAQRCPDHPSPARPCHELQPSHELHPLGPNGYKNTRTLETRRTLNLIIDRMNREETFSAYSYKSLLVPSYGDLIKRTLLESSLRPEKTAVVVSSSGPTWSVSYRCRERFHKEVQSKSCYVFSEVSGRTEPSEHVLGMEELRFSKPVQEKKVQGRPAREPVEAISVSNATNSALVVGRTSKVYAVRFTCQHPESLPHLSNRHILLLC